MQVNLNINDGDALLAQILPKPSNETITDRFQQTEMAPCGAVCNGNCHGLA